MFVAISSSALSGAIGGHISIASLSVQVATYQKQLADCVNCESAKTLQGKENIQEISNKIRVTQESIKQIVAEKSTVNYSEAPAAETPDATNTYTNAGAPVTLSGTDKGSLVDVLV